MVTGHIQTGAVTQDVTAGRRCFLRTVQQPGFYTAADPYSPDGVVQDGAVYTYVGSENIYQTIAPVRRLAIRIRSSPRAIRRAAAALGRQPSIVRRDSGSRFIFPHAFNSLQAAATIRCAITTTPPTRAAADPTELDPATVTHPNACAPEPHDKASLAAAIRCHLQPGRESYALYELRRDAVAGSAGAVLGRQWQPVSCAVLHAPG